MIAAWSKLIFQKTDTLLCDLVLLGACLGTRLFYLGDFWRWRVVCLFYWFIWNDSKLWGPDNYFWISQRIYIIESNNLRGSLGYMATRSLPNFGGGLIFSKVGNVCCHVALVKRYFSLWYHNRWHSFEYSSPLFFCMDINYITLF